MAAVRRQMAEVQRQMAEVQRRYAEYAETDTDMQLDRETERKREWKFQNFQLTRSGPEVRPVRHLGGAGATVLQARRARVLYLHEVMMYFLVGGGHLRKLCLWVS